MVGPFVVGLRLLAGSYEPGNETLNGAGARGGFVTVAGSPAG
jgi:hypothetical protein